MRGLDRCRVWLGVAWSRLHRDDRERGDVPGWVMVTVMTAILVVAILGVFEPAIKTAITNALNSVTGSGGGAAK